MKCLFLLSVLSFTLYGILGIVEDYQDYHNLDCKLTDNQISLIRMLSVISGIIFGVLLFSIFMISD